MSKHNPMHDILSWTQSAAADMAEAYDGSADVAYEDWSAWAGDYMFDEFRRLLKQPGASVETLKDDLAWLAKALPGNTAKNLKYLNETVRLAAA